MPNCLSIQTVALVAALAATFPAQAALTVFTSTASFLAAISSTGTDTFEEASAGGENPSPFNRAAGSYTYKATATGGFYGSGSGSDAALSTNSSGIPVSFGSFSSSIAAIGANIFATDINGNFYTGSLTVLATDSLGATSSQTLAPTDVGTGSFIGFISNSTIVSLLVTPVLTDRFASIDNLTLGQIAPIPEPASMVMMAAGLLALRRATRGRSLAPQA